MGEAYNVKIVKPHGCVGALVDAELAENHGDHPVSVMLAERFLITESELNALKAEPGIDGTQHFVFANLSAKLCTQPFVVAGWSAAEKYLLDHIDATVRPALEPRYPLPEDELSIIDISFNTEGHTRLASFYGKDGHSAHICVEPTNFTTDQLFLWVQALHALGCLHSRSLPTDKAALAELAAEIQQPPNAPAFVIEWADNFLPAWVRLCWRCGLIKCQNRACQPISINDIHLESRDEHIPWAMLELGIPRPELIAAAQLLAALHRSGTARDWNFEMFPGGLYRGNHLVIPLPAWESAIPNDLQGLKALMNAIKQHGQGYIDRLSVSFLNQDPAQTIPDNRKRMLKELVASQLGMMSFPTGDTIEEMNLEDL